MNSQLSPPVRRIYQVGELTELVRTMLEDSLPRIWLEGEVSNFRNPSGHWYFALKDADSQLRCAMFRGNNRLVGAPPRDGQQVLVRGRVTLYTARGDFQMVVEHLEPAGEGALRRAFEQLKRKLEAEGLFDPTQRRDCPALPHSICVITSGTGAALQDIRTTLARRFPMVPVHLIAVPVQGDAAAPAIVQALGSGVDASDANVVILARGGGSLEDLWAFNEESVARAIRACRLPVISGVGHETDVTIADLAADFRAATPTAAAEHAVPDQGQWRAAITTAAQRLERSARRQLANGQQRQLQINSRLQRQSPGRMLQVHAQRLDDCTQTLQRRAENSRAMAHRRLDALSTRLLRRRPGADLRKQREALADLRRRLQAAATRVPQHAGNRLQSLASLLESYNPQKVLQRGYALVTDTAGRVIRDADGVSDGSAIDIRLAEGRLPAVVRRTKDR